MRLRQRPIDINIILVHASTADSLEKENDNFLKDLSTAMVHCKNGDTTIILKNFNANVSDE